MKRVVVLCISIFISTLIRAQEINLIPKPAQIAVKNGQFTLNRAIQITAPINLKNQKSWLIEALNIQTSTSKSAATIILKLNPDFQNEAYQLLIKPNQIILTAKDTQGIAYGIASLIQLSQAKKEQQYIPCLEIKDQPRFPYRGMMLDVSRHFYPFDFIKKYIDALALYKFNNLQLHLTDGAGWRLEIKQFPELTSKAAWREGKTWKEWQNSGQGMSEMGNPNAVGGFYTQEQAKELVAYAAIKGINIIPEIELPGHSDEVLKVYPNLACQVNEKELGGDFCPSNPLTYDFLTKVLSEVMAVFPSKYIHIGGDEASKRYWKQCPRCKEYMKKHQYTNIDQLQSDLIKRIEKFIVSKNRKLIGWDEILEGGLAPEATVMSWRGEQGGIDAAKEKHHVIMTPGQYLYFDKYQQNPETQAEAIGGYLTVEKVYDYEPVPSELNKEEQKYILGAQANLWTEYVPTQEHAMYMTFPRAIALSEINWTAKSLKNWSDFENRLQGNYWLLQRKGINYARPSLQVEITPVFNYAQKNALVRISSMQKNPQIYYTTDGTIPTLAATKYSQAFELSGSKTVKACIITNEATKLKPDTLAIDFHKAIGKKIIYNLAYSKNYVAKKDSTLINGYRGGISFGDGEWQGFEGKGMDVTIDMNEKDPLHSLSIAFMQQNSVGIYIPDYVTVSSSDDGIHFKEIDKQVNENISPKKEGLIIKTFKFDLKKLSKRYIRVFAHDAQKGYLFTDEIIIY